LPCHTRTGISISTTFPPDSLDFATGATAIATMVKPNDTIAIIIIVLFSFLILVAFGVYNLVSVARAGSSSGSQSFADSISEDSPPNEAIGGRG